ncbi:hypothetical protein BZG36_01877 [Bifiguratus adelaidae]|uniref:Uncharacterized protein n=1 Tax=Bifiguratus adelaidae TaxID=1938954 RepID=A0A261Y2G8_9FUNG|nr:hypothetical protein BZG36_01877 [Bifiguratus adelaidae]
MTTKQKLTIDLDPGESLHADPLTTLPEHRGYSMLFQQYDGDSDPEETEKLVSAPLSQEQEDVTPQDARMHPLNCNCLTCQLEEIKSEKAHLSNELSAYKDQFVLLTKEYESARSRLDTCLAAKAQFASAELETDAQVMESMSSDDHAAISSDPNNHEQQSPPHSLTHLQLEYTNLASAYDHTSQQVQDYQRLFKALEQQYGLLEKDSHVAIAKHVEDNELLRLDTRKLTRIVQLQETVIQMAESKILELESTCSSNAALLVQQEHKLKENESLLEQARLNLNEMRRAVSAQMKEKREMTLLSTSLDRMMRSYEDKARELEVIAAEVHLAKEMADLEVGKASSVEQHMRFSHVEQEREDALHQAQTAKARCAELEKQGLEASPNGDLVAENAHLQQRIKELEDELGRVKTQNEITKLKAANELLEKEIQHTSPKPLHALPPLPPTPAPGDSGYVNSPPSTPRLSTSSSASSTLHHRLMKPMDSANIKMMSDLHRQSTLYEDVLQEGRQSMSSYSSTSNGHIIYPRTSSMRSMASIIPPPTPPPSNPLPPPPSATPSSAGDPPKSPLPARPQSPLRRTPSLASSGNGTPSLNGKYHQTTNTQEQFEKTIRALQRKVLQAESESRAHQDQLARLEGQLARSENHLKESRNNLETVNLEKRALLNEVNTLRLEVSRLRSEMDGSLHQLEQDRMAFQDSIEEERRVKEKAEKARILMESRMEEMMNRKTNSKFVSLAALCCCSYYCFTYARPRLYKHVQLSAKCHLHELEYFARHDPSLAKVIRQYTRRITLRAREAETRWLLNDSRYLLQLAARGNLRQVVLFGFDNLDVRDVLGLATLLQGITYLELSYCNLQTTLNPGNRQVSIQHILQPDALGVQSSIGVTSTPPLTDSAPTFHSVTHLTTQWTNFSALAVKQLLSSLPNLRHCHLQANHNRILMANDAAIEHLTSHCSHISTLHVSLQEVREVTLQKAIQKYGKQLVELSVRCESRALLRTIAECATNLQALKLRATTAISHDADDILRILVRCQDLQHILFQSFPYFTAFPNEVRSHSLEPLMNVELAKPPGVTVYHRLKGENESWKSHMALGEGQLRLLRTELKGSRQDLLQEVPQVSF